MSRRARLLAVTLIASFVLGAAACSDVTAPPTDCDWQGSQTSCMQADFQGSQT